MLVELSACHEMPGFIPTNILTLVAVVPARDRHGRPVVALVRRLRAEYPDVAVVAATVATGEFSQDLAALGAAGVHGFLFTDVDSSATVVREALRAARRSCASEVILNEIRDVLPANLAEFVTCCVSYPAESKQVSQVAAQLGTHRKTLFNRCRGLAEGFGAEELVSWCRVLLAAYLLRGGGRTVESVALELDVSSVTGLRNLLRKYTGFSATGLRDQGGFEPAVEAFRCRLGGERMSDEISIA
jgi:AraC-like DNA-binding protein